VSRSGRRTDRDSLGDDGEIGAEVIRGRCVKLSIIPAAPGQALESAVANPFVPTTHVGVVAGAAIECGKAERCRRRRRR
jgi:hypothetical protein